MTADFTFLEQLDRENRVKYPVMPSPRGIHWVHYIKHRLCMLERGMEAYARRRYARLSFDKHCESQREQDLLAGQITKNEPSLVMIGGAQISPSSPIGIKKNKRTPGTRKIQVSIKKLGHSEVILVNEEYTSQVCANCFKKFPKHIYKHRFKACKGCTRDSLLSLPPLIVTKKCRRRKQLDSAVKRLVARGIINQQNQSDEFQPGRLESSKMYFEKNWPLNPADEAQMGDEAVAVTDQPEQQQQPAPRAFCIVWHRDIVAARCIMYKGKWH